MTKAKQDGSDTYLPLLAWRNTLQDSELGSPAQRMLCRRTQSTLPVAEKLLKPCIPNGHAVQARLKHKREQQKKFYDQSARQLPPLYRGDSVRIQTPKGYQNMGVVKEQLNKPRSYLVTSDGRDFRRN